MFYPESMHVLPQSFPNSQTRRLCCCATSYLSVTLLLSLVSTSTIIVNIAAAVIADISGCRQPTEYFQQFPQSIEPFLQDVYKQSYTKTKSFTKSSLKMGKHFCCCYFINLTRDINSFSQIITKLHSNALKQLFYYIPMFMKRFKYI